ncbi:MAG: prepilin-type N-terminal cleavage/methylation domain-containing protein [Acidobacteriota bacterium]|nr:prepilin-type N-terminal cleavage/methylation domain-containing protein [Acidobacteriota bacterium]
MAYHLGHPSRKCGVSHARGIAAPGFTIIELAVVIAIVLVVLGMALPVLVNTSRSRMVTNAQLAVSGAMQAARYRAMSTGLPVELTFSAANATSQLLSCSNCSSTIYDPTVSSYTFAALSTDQAVPFTIAHGAALNADKTLYFRPNGAVQTTYGTTDCTTANIPTFTLTFSNISRTVTIECYGRITVQTP